MAAWSRLLLQRARVLWRGPSPRSAQSVPGGASAPFPERATLSTSPPAPSRGAGGRILDRAARFWRGPTSSSAPGPGAGARLLERAAALWRGPASAPPPLGDAGLTSSSKGIVFSPTEAQKLLADVKLIGTDVKNTAADVRKLKGWGRELNLWVFGFCGMKAKECLGRSYEKIVKDWEPQHRASADDAVRHWLSDF